MTPPEPPHLPALFTLDEGRALDLTHHQLYRAGLVIPFHRLRQRPPEPTEVKDEGEVEVEDDQDAAGISNAEYARRLSRMDRSLIISHQTAAESWGIWLPTRMQTTQIHLARVRGKAGIPRYRNTVGHFIRPETRDVRRSNGFRITSPEWTWVDLASRGLTVDELVAAGDALLQRRTPYPRPTGVIGSNPLATRERIHDVLSRRKGSPGISRLRIAEGLLRERVDSAPESRLRLKLVDAGWTEPEVNPEIHFADGWTCDSDLAWLEWRISLQYEGKHHFTLETQKRSDMRRDEKFRTRGWEPIRVDSDVFSPDGWLDLQDRLVQAIERQRQQHAWVPFTVS